MPNFRMTAELIGENKSGAAIAEMSADLKALDKQLDALDREIRLGVGIDDLASADLKDIERAAIRLDGMDPTVRVDADTKAAEAKITALESRTRALGTLKPTVDVDVDTTGATAQLGKVTAESVALGRLKPTVDVDVDTAGATAQLLAFSGTAVATTGATSVLTKSMIGLSSPLVLGAIGGLALAATAAVGPLAAGLTVAGGAGIVAAGGIGLLAGAIAPSIIEIGKFKEAQKEQETATKAAATAVKSYQDTQASLADAQRGVETAERGVADARRSAAEGVASAENSYRDSLLGVADAQREVKDAGRGVHDAQREAAEGVTSAEAGYEDALRGVADAQREVVSAERGVHDAQREAAEGVASAEADYEDALLGVADAQREVKSAERGLHDAQREAAEGVASAEADHEDALRAVTDAQREVASAERGVSDARAQATRDIESATDAYRDSLRSVEDAEEALSDSRGGLEDATLDVVSAQQELNEALRDEPSNLREMELGVEEARIRQAEATLDAADAQEELNLARRKGDPEEVRRAELNLQSARLDSERASLSEKDAENELTDARRQGTSELQSAKEGYKSSLNARKDAARGVEDSEEGLADSQRNAAKAEKEVSRARIEGARSIRDAQRGVTEAQRALADSQRDALNSEKEISRARAEGARQVRDAQRGVTAAQRALAGSQRDAIKAEKEISLARQEGARQVRDAQRGVAEAQRALANSQRDAIKAEKEISTARREGARQVQEAQRGVVEAQRSLASSQRDAARAEKEIALARREGARQVQEAQRGVVDAQRQAARASAAVAVAAREMSRTQKEAAASGGVLTAANRKLYDSFQELGPAYRSAFRGASKEAAEFGDELLQTTKRTFPALGRESKETVRGMRQEFSGLRKELGGQEKDSLNRVLDSTSVVMRDLTRATGRFGGGFVNFLAEVMPGVEDFTGYLSDVSENFLKWSRTKEARDQIEKWVENAKPLFKSVAENTKDFLGFLISFGNKHGDEVADAIDLIADSLDALFGSKANKEREKDAGKAGKATGNAYSFKFIDAQKDAAKKEGPGVGERWGEAIGKGIGNLSQWLLNSDKRNKSDEAAGAGFAKGVLKGWNDAFSDYDFKKSELWNFLDGVGDLFKKWGGRINGFLIDAFAFGPWKDSELYELLDKGQEGLHDFGTWLEKWGGRIEKFLIDPFSDAYDKIVGNSIIPDLRKDVVKELSGMVPDIGKALENLPDRVGDAFSGAYKKAKGHLDDLKESASDTMGDAGKSIRDKLEQGAEWGKDALRDLDDKGSKSNKSLASDADKSMGDAEKWIRNHLKKGREDGVWNLEELRGKGSKSQKDLQKSSGESMQTAKEDAVRSLENAREMGVAALGVLRDKGGTAMQDARDKFRSPVGTASHDMQAYMNNMLYGMGMVIEKADLDLKKPEKFPINSGTSDPSGREEGMSGRFGMAEGGILRFAGGGFYEGAPTIGPDGGIAKGGAVRVFGEVPGSTEYYINPDAPNEAAKARQPGILEEAARALNRAVVPLGGAQDSDERNKAQRTLSLSARSLGGVYIPNEAVGNTGHAVNEALYNRGVFHYWGMDPNSGDVHEMHEFAEGGKYTGAGFYGVENWQGGFGTEYGAIGLNNQPHMAVDIPAPEGSPIHAVFGGQNYSEPGNSTPHDNATDYGELSARYGHNSAFGKSGAVKAGDIIGYIGSLGLATGPHAHISVAPTISQMESAWNGDRHPDELFGRKTAGSGSFSGPTGGGGTAEDKELLDLKKMSTSGFGGVQPHVAQVGNFMERVFPDILETGGLRPGDPQDHGKGLALDYMTSPGGTTGPPGSPLQDKISQYIQARWDNFATSYIIDKQRIDFGNGFEPMDNRGSVTENHGDHVHQSFMPSPGTKFGTTALVGGTTVDIMPIIDEYIKKVPDFGKGLPPESAEKIAGGARDSIVEKLMSSAPSASTSGVSSGPMSGDQKDTAEWMAKEAVKRQIPDVLPVMTSLVESGLKNVNYGDRDSLGYFQQRPSSGWGTPEQIMDPAYSLDKFLDVAEEMRRKVSWQDASALGSWAQDVQRSAFPDRYAEQYGTARGLVGPVGAGGEHGPTPFTSGGFAMKRQFAEVGERGPEFFMPLHDPNAGRMFMKFLKDLSPAGFDSQEARSEYTRKLSSGGASGSEFQRNSSGPNANKPGYVQAEDGSWVPKSFYAGRPSRDVRPSEAGGRDRETARALSKMADKLEKMGQRLEESARDDADRLVETLERLGVEIPEGVRESVITNLETGRRTGDAMKKGFKRANKVLAATGARFDVEDY